MIYTVTLMDRFKDEKTLSSIRQFQAKEFVGFLTVVTLPVILQNQKTQLSVQKITLWMFGSIAMNMP